MLALLALHKAICEEKEGAGYCHLKLKPKIIHMDFSAQNINK
jgi:hypothetical protein